MSKQRTPLKFDVEATAPVAPPAAAKPAAETKQVGARISADLYRRFKARAAIQGVTVAVLVEKAIENELNRDN